MPAVPWGTMLLGSSRTRQTETGKGAVASCGEVWFGAVWWLDLHVYTRRSLGISTGCSKKDLQAGDKEEKKKTTTTGQTWTMWTRTTLKMNVQWVLCCFWSRGREKKGGSSAQIQLYIVQVGTWVWTSWASHAVAVLVLVLVLVVGGERSNDVSAPGSSWRDASVEGSGGWCRGGGVLVLPPRLLILALVNKLWQSSMEGMPVKNPIQQADH